MLTPTRHSSLSVISMAKSSVSRYILVVRSTIDGERSALTWRRPVDDRLKLSPIHNLHGGVNNQADAVSDTDHRSSSRTCSNATLHQLFASVLWPGLPERVPLSASNSYCQSGMQLGSERSTERMTRHSGTTRARKCRRNI